MRRVALLLVLAGCGGITPQQMGSMSIAEVCYWSVAGGPQTEASARQVLASRKHVCSSAEIEVEIARRQARQDANNAAAAILLRPQQRAPQTINCTTDRTGGVTTTTCR
jgi:hypothetical protein